MVGGCLGWSSRSVVAEFHDSSMDFFFVGDIIFDIVRLHEHRDRVSKVLFCLSSVQGCKVLGNLVEVLLRGLLWVVAKVAVPFLQFSIGGTEIAARAEVAADGGGGGLSTFLSVPVQMRVNLLGELSSQGLVVERVLSEGASLVHHHCQRVRCNPAGAMLDWGCWCGTAS